MYCTLNELNCDANTTVNEFEIMQLINAHFKSLSVGWEGATDHYRIKKGVFHLPYPALYL